MESGQKRSYSYLIIILVYASALAAGIIVFNYCKSAGVILKTLYGDIAATLVVWLFGILFGNSSLYDPYWSVAPIAIIPCWILSGDSSAGLSDFLILAAVLIWGLRLTLNWGVRWMGFGHQDWRYSMLKDRLPRLWFLVNLMGINMMPTVLVFLGLIPAYHGIFSAGSPGILSWIGFLICICAALIQFFADKQMESFTRSSGSGGHCIDEGLWRYSRHPNYFGEVSFWWGIWLIQMGIIPSLWKTIIGPLLITLLFIFISIPMMESHVKSTRPSYTAYQKSVSKLIPWFRKC